MTNTNQLTPPQNMLSGMKILVIGHKQHGKGTFAKIASETFNIPSMGTSRFGTEHMFNLLKDEYGYLTPEECYNDRGSYRKLWFDELERYNALNPSQLIEDIYLKHALAEGLRNRYEYNGIKDKKLADLIIWVDASKRLPLEDKSSMELNENDAHITITNNDSENEFIEKVKSLLLAITSIKS